jgi:hypothetical protein
MSHATIVWNCELCDKEVIQEEINIEPWDDVTMTPPKHWDYLNDGRFGCHNCLIKYGGLHHDKSE